MSKELKILVIEISDYIIRDKWKKLIEEKTTARLVPHTKKLKNGNKTYGADNSMEKC